MNTTSVTLLERLRLPGEEQAWRHFVELYAPLILDWSRRIGLNATDSEDLVQDVLTTLVHKLREFDYDRNQSFRGWLRTITTNRGRDFLRRRGLAAGVALDGMLDPATPNGADVFAEAEYRRQLVSRALDLMQTEFESNTWKACWECVVNDRRADDVAQQLGMSVNAVFVAKSRVLRRLRSELLGLLD